MLWAGNGRQPFSQERRDMSVRELGLDYFLNLHV